MFDKRKKSLLITVKVNRISTKYVYRARDSLDWANSWLHFIILYKIGQWWEYKIVLSKFQINFIFTCARKRACLVLALLEVYLKPVCRWTFFTVFQIDLLRVFDGQKVCLAFFVLKVIVKTPFIEIVRMFSLGYLRQIYFVDNGLLESILACHDLCFDC